MTYYGEKSGDIFIHRNTEKKNYPAVSFVADRFKNDKVAIRSVYFTDQNGEYVNTLYVDKTYTTHVVVECLRQANDLIVGFVLETRKDFLCLILTILSIKVKL